MIDSISAYDIANEIRMKRTQHAGAFLIVEGATDARIFKAFTDIQACQVIVAHNKDKAIQVLNILEKENFTGLLAIVDADFGVLEGITLSSSNLFLTDTHDIETTIIRSPALEKVLAEYGSESKLNNFTRKLGKDIRLIILESGLPVGYLRWASLKNHLALRFEDLPFSSFVDSNTLAVDINKLIRTLKNHSQKPFLKEKDVREQVQNLKDDSHDSWHVCCGHDLICILSIGLRKAIGSNNATEVRPEVIEKSLRLAYEISHFYMTQLYQSIRAWEQNNRPFKVLP
jgi:hypothetical protein